MKDFTVDVSAPISGAPFAVFRLQGSLDAQTIQDLEKHYHAEPAASHYKWIMDLSKLEYISSAGLGSFVAVLSHLRERGGDIFFVGVTQKMDRIFKVIGIHRMFRIFENEVEAFGA
jgi:anti-sigma B factor antagonist